MLPKTNIIPVTETFHGHQITDKYRWLESDAPDVQEWVASQNAYTQEYLATLSQREFLKKRFEHLFRTDSFGVLYPYKGRYFIVRKNGLENHGVVYGKDGLEGAEKVLLNPNKWSEDGTTAMDWWYPSRDGKFIAYGVSESGSEFSTLHVLEVENNLVLKEKIPFCRFGSVMWVENGFYYSKFPSPGSVPAGEEHFHQKIFFHQLGGDDDPLVFDPNDKEKFCTVQGSSDEAYAIINVSKGWSANDIFLKKMPDREISPLFVGEGALFTVDILDHVAYVLTNKNAPKFKLLALDLQSNKETVLIPESGDVLESFQIIGGKVVVHYLSNVHSLLKVFHLNGKFEREIPLPGLCSVSGVAGEYNKDELFFTIESFHVPRRLYHYNVHSHVLKQLEAMHISLAKDLVMEQLWCESKDKTKIPFFIVHQKNIKYDSSNPCVLYGYGGFNITLAPYFGFNALPLIETGGVYVVANLRGGGEFGSQWHEQGMLHNKQNVFDDFIAVAEYLVNKKITSQEKLAIMGGSNGGLLTGAVMVQRPELFKAVVSSVPLLDMLRFHKFLLGQHWVPEYGDPEKKEDFEYLLKYSPYHHVQQKNFPAVMFTTGISDTRVHPLHAMKMTALLQSVSKNLVVLRLEMKAGHGQGKPLAKRIEELSDEWAFLFDQLKIKLMEA